MNWITLAVLGAVAAWFEYNYQRSRRKKGKSEGEKAPAPAPVTETAHAAAQQNSEPSVAPGDQNDKRLNSPI
jgi:hypothetical protein